MTINITELQQVNSTSYVDTVGLQQGLDRLPGEDAVAYVKRLERASNSRRDHTLEGVVNEISLQLGLSMSPTIRVTSTDPNATLTCSIGGLVLVSGVTTTIIPLLNMELDKVWKWFLLSEVTQRVNAVSGFSAVLLTADAPAVQLARQSNVRFDTTVSPPSQQTVWPYELVGSEVGLVGLTDKEFASVAATSTSALSYQVRETIQQLMSTDRSYWGR